jgi:hypothetical protein
MRTILNINDDIENGSHIPRADGSLADAPNGPDVMRTIEQPCSSLPLMCSLTTPELFVATAARLWVLPYREAEGNGLDWRAGFRAAGLSDVASVAFDLIMRGMVASRRGELDIRWPGCHRLGADEACLVDCLSLLQQQRGSDAVARMTVWLAPAAMRILHAPASRFAELLAAGGLIFPTRRQSIAAQAASFETYRQFDPGLLLAH